jgi:8-oxo-dGTP diphosphatase
MKQTTLCYLEHEGRYLMLHRVKKQNDASHDKWIGVGGKCEADESPDECMLREVNEETGLTVTSWRYRGIVTFISDVWPCEYMHLFTADKWNADSTPSIGLTAQPSDSFPLFDCDEGDLQWVDKERVFDLTLWPGDRIFLRLIMNAQQPFFSLKLVYKGDDLVAAKLDGLPLPL